MRAFWTDPARAINPRPELSPARNGPGQFRAAQSRPGPVSSRAVSGRMCSSQARVVPKKARAGSGRPGNNTNKNYDFLIGVDLTELIELKDVPLNWSMKKFKNRIFR